MRHWHSAELRPEKGCRLELCGSSRMAPALLSAALATVSCEKDTARGSVSLYTGNASKPIRTDTRH